MVCKKFYACFLERFGCKKKSMVEWTEQDDNTLTTHIINGYGLDEICEFMKKSPDVIRYKIIDQMMRFSNYEAVYHMGPGYKYATYIDFIRSHYAYESL